MIRLAQSSGTLAMVATPHCNIEGHTEEYSLNMLADGLNTLNRRIAEAGYQVEVMPGMEIYASEDIAEKDCGREAYQFKWFQILFDRISLRYLHWLGGLHSGTHAGSKRVVPVIAHPERYFCVQAHPEITYN